MKKIITLIKKEIKKNFTIVKQKNTKFGGALLVGTGAFFYFSL